MGWTFYRLFTGHANILFLQKNMMGDCFITNTAKIFYWCNPYGIRAEQTVISYIMPPGIHFNTHKILAGTYILLSACYVWNA